MGIRAAQPQSLKVDTADQSRQAGEAWDRFQALYGEKPEKQRVIKKKLDKDDFLRIMITQLKHQDPTKPFDMDKMAQEMTQMASLEQLGNVNKALTKLADANRPLERMAMTNLIGKTVTLDQSRFPHQSGENSIMTFNLPEDSETTVLRLVSEEGETILEKEIGKMKKGSNQYIWDGLQDNNLPAKSGSYFMQISATGKGEQPILVNTKVKSQVIGVSFQGKEPVLLVGNAQNQSRVKMSNVIRIEDGSPVPGRAAAQPGVDAAAKNMFAFKKGVGSVPLSNAQQDKIENTMKEKKPDVPAGRAPAPRNVNPVQARKVTQPQVPWPQQQPKTAAPKAEGFPSGLGSPKPQTGGAREG